MAKSASQRNAQSDERPDKQLAKNRLADLFPMHIYIDTDSDIYTLSFG